MSIFRRLLSPFRRRTAITTPFSGTLREWNDDAESSHDLTSEAARLADLISNPPAPLETIAASGMEAPSAIVAAPPEPTDLPGSPDDPVSAVPTLDAFGLSHEERAAILQRATQRWGPDHPLDTSIPVSAAVPTHAQPPSTTPATTSEVTVAIDGEGRVSGPNAHEKAVPDIEEMERQLRHAESAARLALEEEAQEAEAAAARKRELDAQIAASRWANDLIRGHGASTDDAAAIVPLADRRKLLDWFLVDVEEDESRAIIERVIAEDPELAPVALRALSRAA